MHQTLLEAATARPYHVSRHGARDILRNYRTRRIHTRHWRIGFAALSGHVDGNRALAVVSPGTGAAVVPTEATIRDFSYPFARRLYMNQVADARLPSDAEHQLLDAMLDRSFLDPILLVNQFVTCLSVEDGGCP